MRLSFGSFVVISICFFSSFKVVKHIFSHKMSEEITKKVAEKEEPLLKENPSRFVILPIQVS